MGRMTCRAVRRQLSLFHDRELAVDAQIGVEVHLARCPPCARALQGLANVGRVMRESARRQTAPVDVFEGLPSAVVSRFQAEQAQTLGSRVGRMFEDMHLVWAGLAGTAAIVCCMTTIFGLVYLSAPSRADSLFGVMRAMAVPVQPVLAAGVDWNVRLPRVRADAAMPLVLGETGAAGGREMVFALAAVVTREGRIANLEILMSDERDRDILVSLLSAASAAHFEPARVRGAPISMNLVWLLAHTTVRAVGDIGPEAALRLARPLPV